MLGGEDDLAAVLAVLDRLSNELVTNRSALDETCEAADALGDGVAVPQEMLIEDSDGSALRELQRERYECQFVKDNLDEVVHKVAESKTLLRNLIDKHKHHELDFLCQASKELIAWKERVGTADDEYHDLKNRSLEIDARLAQLYGKLQMTSATTGGSQNP